MKKIILLSTTLCLLLMVLVGCNTEDYPSEDGLSFRATILEIHDTHVLVQTIKGMGFQYITRVTFGTGELEDIGASVGDVVRVVFTGDILTTYPEQVFATSWSLIERAEQSRYTATNPAPILPRLYIENVIGEGFTAIQLGTSWAFFDEEGNVIGGINADSPHPLQLNPKEFYRATINLWHNPNLPNEQEYLGMTFLYGEPARTHIPHNITVTRWRLEYASGSQEINAYGDGEEVVELINPSYPVILNPGHLNEMIPVLADGYDYIYMVEAEWQEGRSVFTFRVNSRNTESEQEEIPIFDWRGVYRGVLPSEAGTEIKVQLVLSYIEGLGGSFELTFEHLYENQSIPDIGSSEWNEWSERIGSQSGMFIWEQENLLRLDLGDWPGNWPPFYRVGNGILALVSVPYGSITDDIITKLTKIDAKATFS